MSLYLILTGRQMCDVGPLTSYLERIQIAARYPVMEAETELHCILRKIVSKSCYGQDVLFRNQEQDAKIRKPASPKWS
jgi:hypothetical protein